MTLDAHGTIRAQLPARLIDLSPGGALFVLATTLKVGAVHDFALDLDGHVVRLQGEVRHCRATQDNSGHQVGVQFLSVDPVDERVLRNYLESRR